jgi:diadenosine tetraphosphatase ApaH/serine/threonine PP2A family protein phosphatase
MKLALISDVHSNLEALTAVLARAAVADQISCLGDMIGYGPNPNECLALIRERVRDCVLGNHDVGAIDGYGLDYFNAFAREAIVWTQSVLDPAHAAWLDCLGYELRLPDYLLVHGAPVEYFTYILDEDAAARAFAATDAWLVFAGHTHLAEYYALAPDGSIQRGSRRAGGRLELERGKRYIINPGSVGQPRDANPQASFAVYDSEAGAVVWERVEYPIATVQEKIEAARLPDYLGKRLAVGR